MSDLISRSETIKKLREYADQKCFNGEEELANGILKAICFMAKEDNVPAAYDVEKVVEQIRCDCYSMGFDESQTEILVNDIRKGGVHE